MEQYGHLQGADESTFAILSDDWAKDKQHVWYKTRLVEGADAPSFYLGANGLPKDKNHVYIRDYKLHNYRQLECDIDVATAEYFYFYCDKLDNRWIRDQNYIYYFDTRLDVDRNAFVPLFANNLWTDGICIYEVRFDSSINKEVPMKIYTLNTPIDSIYYKSNSLIL